MEMIDRRRFLALSAAAGSSVLLPHEAFARTMPATSVDFDFLFFTDTHLQPELDAAKGCDMAFKKMRGIKADFAMQGGDHIFDALAVPKARGLSLFEMYDKTQQDLSVPVYHAIGNHDIFGVYPASGMPPTDPLYGKKFYNDHIGKTYYSFDHKGVHFVVLDSIYITDDRAYEGRIDGPQMQWLRADLALQAAATPIVVVTHVPLITAYENYADKLPNPPRPYQMSVANTREIYPLFHGHNVLAVLQGHTHVNERVEFQGVPYITSGAVSGNWWRGTHLGAPEGFTVVSIRGGKLSTRYETYGFQAVDPANT